MSTQSPVWQAAIDRYYEKLRQKGIKRSVIDHDVWSIHTLEDLLQQMRDFVPANSYFYSQWIENVHRLIPIFLRLDDLASVVALALGMHDHVAAIIWGSMKVILKV